MAVDASSTNNTQQHTVKLISKFPEKYDIYCILVQSYIYRSHSIDVANKNWTKLKCDSGDNYTRTIRKRISVMN